MQNSTQSKTGKNKQSKTGKIIDSKTQVQQDFKNIIAEMKLNENLSNIFLDSFDEYFSDDKDARDIFEEICSNINKMIDGFEDGDTLLILEDCKEYEDEERNQNHQEIVDKFLQE